MSLDNFSARSVPVGVISAKGICEGPSFRRLIILYPRVYCRSPSDKWLRRQSGVGLCRYAHLPLKAK